MTALLDTLMQQFDSDAVSQISQQLGVDPQTAQKGIEVGLPLLVSALARESSSPEGAQSLSNALARDHDGSILNNLPAAIGNYQSQSGDGILRHVLGDRRDNVETAVTQSTGLDAAALLKMLAPVVLGALGNQQRQQNLDPGSLATTLQQEHQQIQQSDNNLMSLATRILDANQDGSIADEVTGMIGRLFSQRK